MASNPSILGLLLSNLRRWLFGQSVAPRPSGGPAGGDARLYREELDQIRDAVRGFKSLDELQRFFEAKSTTLDEINLWFEQAQKNEESAWLNARLEGIPPEEAIRFCVLVGYLMVVCGSVFWIKGEAWLSLVTVALGFAFAIVGYVGRRVREMAIARIVSARSTDFHP